MLKSFIKFLSNNIALFCAVILFQTVSSKAFSAKYSSNSSLIKEIEKNLLFDKDSREKINVYRKDRSIRKSDYNIGTPAPEIEANEDISIVVVNSKAGSFDLRKKEKLAYNAVLVGQYEVAIALYKEVIKAEPENQYSKFSLAVVYQKVGQFRQAKELYEGLLKNNTKNKEEIIGNLLAILIEESPKDSLYLLSRLTVQNPKSDYILAQAAVVYDKMNDTPQAIKLLNRAITIDPTNLAYKYNLAIMYDKSSQKEIALSLYADVARSYSPEDQFIEIDQVKKRIETLKSQL